MQRRRSVPLVRTLVGPLGPVHVAASASGIVAVEPSLPVEAFMAGLTRRLGVIPELERRPAGGTDPRTGHLDRASSAIAALLAGHPPTDLPPIDLDDRPEWDRRVLAAVQDVPWGQTVSYGEIARRIGAAGAAQAVGGALGRNPITLIVPCHRVIAADGTIGGYGGDGWASRLDGLARKRALLGREGVIVATRDG